MPSSSSSSPSSPISFVDCPFCEISHAYPPTSPFPLSQTSESRSASADSGSDSNTPSSEIAYTLLSTPSVLAFLDHMPITRGHVLLITRQHREKLSDCDTSEAAVLGAWLSVLSRAVMRGVGALASASASATGGAEDAVGAEVKAVQDWNVVQNNGERAAQVVKHVHYHIIPRPGEVPDLRARSWTMFGRGQRGDLDEEEALRTRDRIRWEIGREVAALSRADRRILGISENGEGSRL